MKRILSSLIFLIGLANVSPLQAAPTKDTTVPSFTLNTLDGKPWSPADQKSKAIAIVFLSTECPMANSYIPALNEIARTYAEKGLTLVGVNANKEETLADVKAHVKEYRIAFPMLKDDAHKAVHALAVRTTPQAVVLDAKHVLRYSGRIDDAYSARLKPKAKTTRKDLVAAIEDVLAGREVKLARTEAFGCPIPGVARKEVNPAKVTVTYHRDVLPILQSACQSCHRPGQVGPFSLMTYTQAVKWAEDIVGETKAKRMPPWKPEQRGVFTNERSLTAEQLRTLETWLAQGTPEGDVKDAPAPVTFTDGWKLGKPDMILEMPTEAVVAATGRDLFHIVVFPTNLPEDRYIAAVEVLPGNPRVVHHTIQIVDTKSRAKKLAEKAQAKVKPTDRDRGPGYSTRMGFGFLPDPSRGLGGWAPGLVPQRLPEGVGFHLPKNSDIVMQIHYHRTGKEERDRTKVGLYFQKGPVKNHFQALPVPGLFFRLPAGQDNIKIQSTMQLTDDVTLYYLVPHMHLLGKKISLTAEIPGKKEETLISIDSWDYNWQEMYQLKTPKKLPKGTLLRVRATYDNSADNPLNPSDPPRAVRFGEQTTDEMCFVFCGVSAAKPGFKFRPVFGK